MDAYFKHWSDVAGFARGIAASADATSPADAALKFWGNDEDNNMTRTLPNDYARCDGSPNWDFDIHPQCSKCLRYTERETDNPRQSWMIPPLNFIDGKCPKFEGEVK